MNTIESNMLIAEFMGEYNVHDTNGHWECSNCGKQWSAMMGDNEVPQIHTECLPDLLTHAKHHKSWDWLMPVVEKIESLGSSTEIRFSLKKNRHVCEIRKFGFAHEWGDSKIEATYKAVVEFIKWYNNQ